ncbi:hypothetical protein GTO27_00820 [Candidatus Bathyarchaeota archaeon]|nr:hypothetical protein [Candidatus Bathyarchaeota archaeon]
MVQEVFADDIICGLLFLCSKHEFKGNQRYLQETIFELKRKHGGVFDDFVFSEDLYPYSQLLERVFSRLELSRIISFDNPDYKYFVLTPNGRNYIEKKIMPLLSDKLEILRNIAEDFEKAVGKE